MAPTQDGGAPEEVVAAATQLPRCSQRAIFISQERWTAEFLLNTKGNSGDCFRYLSVQPMRTCPAGECSDLFASHHNHSNIDRRDNAIVI
jgi:hypothetical protein